MSIFPSGRFQWPLWRLRLWVGYGGIGILGVILMVVVVLLLMGRL